MGTAALLYHHQHIIFPKRAAEDRAAPTACHRGFRSPGHTRQSAGGNPSRAAIDPGHSQDAHAHHCIVTTMTEHGQLVIWLNVVGQRTWSPPFTTGATAYGILSQRAARATAVATVNRVTKTASKCMGRLPPVYRTRARGRGTSGSGAHIQAQGKHPVTGALGLAEPLARRESRAREVPRFEAAAFVDVPPLPPGQMHRKRAVLTPYTA